MNIDLNINEYGFLITALHNSTLQGKDVHFVSNILKRLEDNYRKLSEVPSPPPLQK